MKKLALRTEGLTDLTTEELGGLAGAAEVELTPQCASTPIKTCLPTMDPIHCIVSYPCNVS